MPDIKKVIFKIKNIKNKTINTIDIPILVDEKNKEDIMTFIKDFTYYNEQSSLSEFFWGNILIIKI